MGGETQNIGKSVNEMLVLSALRTGPKHGYQIALDVESGSGGVFELQHGTLYPILHRLEREGLIRGRWTEGEGRKRKEYELTGSGLRHLSEEAGRLREVLEALVAMIGRGGGDAIQPSAAEG